MKDSFLLYKSFYGPVSGLSDKQLGRLFRAIFLYQIDQSTQVDADIQMAFAFFKNQMDIDGGKYQKVVERNKRNGSKGGRPSKEESCSREAENPENPNNPKNPVGFKKPKKADNENEYDNLSLIDSSSTSPPSRAREGGEFPNLEPSVNPPSATPEKGCAEKAPPNPLPEGTYEYIPVAAVGSYLKSSADWFEAFCMNNHLGRGYVLAKIDEFARECANRGETAKDKRDCKRHFNNWLRKNRQHDEPRTTTSRGTYGDMSLDEFDRATRERVARRLAAEQTCPVGPDGSGPFEPF